MLRQLLKSALWTVGTIGLLATVLTLCGLLNVSGMGLAIIAGILGAYVNAWRASKRGQLYTETPTTPIAESKPGRVEFLGNAASVGGRLLRDPVQDQCCVWFLVKSFRGSWPRLTDAKPSIVATSFSKSDTPMLKEAMSSRPFALRDFSGVCLVDHSGAEFDLKPAVVVDDAARVTHLIWRIAENQSLTILGHFKQNDSGDEYRGEISRPSDSPYLISSQTPADLEAGEYSSALGRRGFEG